MSITRGITYSSTEQITNTKLHNLIDLSTISVGYTEIASGMLSSLASASGKVPPQNFWNLSNFSTNASLPDISVGTAFNLYYSTYASLATFINARVGQRFTLIAQQASFPSIVDVGKFKISGNWTPATSKDNIEFLYDGTDFVELGRTTV